MKFFERFHIPAFGKFGLLDGIVFNNDYKSWHRNRNFVSPALASPKFLRGFVISIEKLFRKSEYRWKSIINDGIELDFSEWMKCFTTDITISQVTKQPSYSLASFDINNEIAKSEEVIKSLKFTDAAKSFFSSIPYFLFIPSFMTDYVPGFISFRKKCERNINYMNETIFKFIDKRRKELEEGAELDSDLLDHLLMAHTSVDFSNNETDKVAPMTNNEIKACLWDILLAGVDSTGNSLSFLIYNIAKNPEFLVNIHKEIKKVFGPGQNIE
ncbi:2516_t:CDS:2, partial [Scutellospora calospora]